MVALETSIIVDTHWTHQKQSVMNEQVQKVFKNFLWEEGWHCTSCLVLLRVTSINLITSYV